ncbi:sarcoplasmic calcium-binding proteins II, V, VI, and VII-like [Eriocheir sinensis]|uniref:sarcoplasmic calcium-binding proteins II, V, VI, and VII-like n=1 Tax=Eriocheir sinensis TaxID=95602 RepID=UPI0021C93E3D|nr:sarcoplasmic calcium-binding proteins II, V, VI, and VII-like [Eriocheir sinensis]
MSWPGGVRGGGGGGRGGGGGGGGGWAWVCPCCPWLCPQQGPLEPTISPFRREKLLFEFNTFFDVNHDGLLEKRDLEMAAHRLCKRGAWLPDDPRAARVNKLMTNLWLALRRHADRNHDEKVTRNEWVKLWEEVEYTWHAVGPAEDSHLTELQNGGGRRYPEWLREYFNYKFMLLDIAGDGVLDEEEFVYIMTQHGASDNDAKNAWFLMCKGRRVLEQAGFEELCEEFFLSDDPTSAGTYLGARLYFLPGEQRDASP